MSGPEPRREEALARLELVADTYLSVATPVQRALPALLGRAAGAARPDRRARGRQPRRSRTARRPAAPRPLLRGEGGWSAVLRIPATLGEEERVLSLLEEQDVLVHPGYFFDFPREAYLVLSLLPAARGVRGGADAHPPRAIKPERAAEHTGPRR